MKTEWAIDGLIIIALYGIVLSNLSFPAIVAILIATVVLLPVFIVAWLIAIGIVEFIRFLWNIDPESKD